MSSIVNESGLKPLGRSVLVEPYEPEIKASIIQLPDSVRERSLMVESRAVVIEVGPSAWEDEKEHRAKPGDRVLITKFAGFIAKGTLDDKTYRFVNDRDIFAGIGAEK
jgi:co-chaperonin GroES (HSP10)